MDFKSLHLLVTCIASQLIANPSWDFITADMSLLQVELQRAQVQAAGTACKPLATTRCATLRLS
jgi:hypothetical protein